MAKPTTDQEDALDTISIDLPPLLIHTVGQASEISEETSTEITEVTTSGQHSKQQHLVLEIPEKPLFTTSKDDKMLNMPLTPQQTPKGVNFSPLHSPTYVYANESRSPSTSRGKSSIKSLVPKLSFKCKNRTSEIEKAAILALGGSPSDMRRKNKMYRTLSFTNLFTPRTRKASSLPVTPIAYSNPESMHGRNTLDQKGWIQRPMHRSHSVPELIKDGCITQIESLSGVFRIIPTMPKGAQGTHLPINVNPRVEADANDEEDGKDIAEEQAVCRICMVELQEGADDTLKMECNCKGELALAHQQCAVKWFSFKGNKTCEVCKQEVKNLPVTILRIQRSQRLVRRRNRAMYQTDVPRYRVWQDVPVLVIVSMLAYFGFLEQLLVNKMGSGAIAISLPFSCIMGLLASMTSTTMVRRRFAWIYAMIQFILVVGFAHMFYSKLKVTGVLPVLLATCAGFGGTMCGTLIIYEFLKWRERWCDGSNRSHGAPDIGQPQEYLEPAHVPQDQPQQEGGSMVAIQPQRPTQTAQDESDQPRSRTVDSPEQESGP